MIESNTAPMGPEVGVTQLEQTAESVGAAAVNVSIQAQQEADVDFSERYAEEAEGFGFSSSV